VTGHSAESSANVERGLFSSLPTMMNRVAKAVNNIPKIFLASRLDKTNLG